MAYGVPSFGVPRTYSVYSSPYGAGYGYGYAPASFLPGRYGVGMWRHYYERWASMTIDRIGPKMIGHVPQLAAFSIIR